MCPCVVLDRASLHMDDGLKLAMQIKLAYIDPKSLNHREEMFSSTVAF